MAEARLVTVEIAGQRYPIRSGLDPGYVAELAAYVDQKIRSAASAAPASDIQGLAVLVALNIADELFRTREQQSSSSGRLSERAMRIEELLDDVLLQDTMRQAVNAY
ncbi:MAG: cell division protein ZapA [Vicinamibacterales bacterium]|nr:cell division protein ZapA [Acidobacteriota bacterium]